MNDNLEYRVLSVKKRRKHLAAVKIAPGISEEELKCERDNDGAILVDTSLVDEGLVREGQALSFDNIVTLVESSAVRRATERALWYVSTSDCSAKSLYEKLVRAFPGYAAKRAVERLQELGYIDDERYAKRICDVMTQRGVSKRELISKLIAKGVPADLARTVAQTAETDPSEQLKIIIEKKYRGSLRDENDIRRVTAALTRKGFNFSDIRAALKNYVDFDNSEDY